MTYTDVAPLKLFCEIIMKLKLCLYFKNNHQTQ